MDKPRISDQEFRERVVKTQKAMREENIDLLLCFGNEAEPQFVRYYCDYWPSFESAGVLIPAEGDALLIIGPESETFAGYVSRIKKIRRLLAFRESSEPEYPGAKLETFSSVFKEALGGKKLKRFGLAGYSLMPHVVFRDMAETIREFTSEDIVKADLVVSKQRVIKSPMELACLREAYRITQEAMKKTIAAIRPGMTENQVKGVALAAIFDQGGEGEAYPFWILAGSGSNQAISRCRNKTLCEGDLVQLQIGARYQGYAATMGRSVVLGKASDYQHSIIEAALAAQKAILDVAKAGVNAKAVSDAHLAALAERGCQDYVLYGPCHGTGLMEGEYPWIESNSNYLLEPDMTFCTCVYLGDDANKVEIRVEDGFRITENGVESFFDYRREVIEI